MNMDHEYARGKLTALLRDLDAYTGKEFWRQMSRIAAGATGTDHAEGIAEERDSLQRLADVRAEQRDALAAHLERLARAGRYLHHELQQWSLTERAPETSAAMSTWGVIVDETPATSLAGRNAEQRLKGAEAYKEALEDATNPIIWPHIEGAFEVWRSAHAEQANTPGERS